MIFSIIACLLPPKEFPIQLPGVKLSVIKRWHGAVYDPAPDKVGCLSEDGAAVWDTRLNPLAKTDPASWQFRFIKIYGWNDARVTAWGFRSNHWRVVAHAPPVNKIWEVKIDRKVATNLVAERPNTGQILIQSDGNGALWFHDSGNKLPYLDPIDNRAKRIPVSKKIFGGYFDFPTYFSLHQQRFAVIAKAGAYQVLLADNRRRAAYEVPSRYGQHADWNQNFSGGLGLLKSGMLIQTFEIGGKGVLDRCRKPCLMWCPSSGQGGGPPREVSRIWQLLAVSGSGRKAIFARLKDPNQVTPLSGRIGNNIAETVLVTVRDDK